MNSYYRTYKARNFTTRLFLHFWNLAATFRNWSSGKKNPYLKYVSSHFLILAIEWHLVRFRLGASFTFELHCSLPSTPSLLVLFRFTCENMLFTSSSLTNSKKLAILKITGVSACFRGISRLPSAFVFLRWFKLAHISIQVCTSHGGCKQGIDQLIFNRNRFHVKLHILSPSVLFE